MNTAVIGGAGFIGSHLCDALIKEGHRVICIDNFSLGTKENIKHLNENNNFELYCCDAAEKTELLQILSKEKPEYIFHLAANSDIRASSVNPEVEYRNTYSTTFNILFCMKELGIKNLFFASTSAVYGDKRGEILDENTANLNPVSYYGAAKLGSEALISAFSHMNEINALVFRFPNVIGPRLTHGVIFDFIKKLKTNPNELEILGNGKQTKPYIYVLDLISAIMKFKNNINGITLYNVGVETATSVTEIADIVCEEMKLTGVKYNYTGGEVGWKGDVPEFQYCINKIKNAGWSAEYTSKQAVRLTVRNNL